MKGMKEIKFDNRWELVKHLYDVGPLKSESGLILFWEESSPKPIRRVLDESSCPGVVDIDATYYIQSPWYENIPEGKYVPCWVSKSNPDPDCCDDSAAVRYSPEGNKEYPFIDIIGCRYIYATPRTDIWVPE